jgi:hypothetical protein
MIVILFGLRNKAVNYIEGLVISGLKRSTGLKRTGFKNKPSSQMKRSGFKQKTYAEVAEARKAKALTLEKDSKPAYKNMVSKKRTGLGGIGRNNKEIEFHGRVAKIGCLACWILGVRTGHILRVHHIDGRKQSLIGDYSEWKVIPLCDQHHRPDISFAVNGLVFNLDAPSVHTRKKLFTRVVGTEEELVLLVYDILGETPPWLTLDDNGINTPSPDDPVINDEMPSVDLLVNAHRQRLDILNGQQSNVGYY